LGGEAVVPLCDVVAICDRELPVQARASDEFLKTARDRGQLLDVSGGQPKSFVITKDRVYLSQISSLTLKKRAENIREAIEALEQKR
jgi:regulator of extracellular matrix RemA (YlzA/DUF370 family)